jgi:hypothetical protein
LAIGVLMASMAPSGGAVPAAADLAPLDEVYTMDGGRLFRVR